jgi:hypothetical protein
VENSVRNARPIGEPAAGLTLAGFPLAGGLDGGALDDGVLDEHAVSAVSAATASPQTPARRVPGFMGPPNIGRCQATAADASPCWLPRRRGQVVTAVTVRWQRR